MAVVTGPSSPDEPMLSREIRLCRAALLYGDAVTLYSPNALMLGSLEQLGGADDDGRMAFMRTVLPILQPDRGQEFIEAWDGLNQLRRKRHRTPDELRLVIALRQQLKQTWAELAEVIGQLLETAGAHELVPALQSGLLELHPILEAGMSVADDLMIKGLVARTGEVLADSTMYPLFDDAMGDLVRAGLQQGMFTIPPRTGVHARQAGAAAGLFEMLPSFPMAHVDEILDIRAELEGPLVRFRGALAELAVGMQADAHDEGFREELDDLWVAKVAPALREIHDLIGQHTYLRELANRLTNAGQTLAAAGLGVVMAKGAHAPDLLALGTAMAIPAIRAEWERRNVRREVQRHQFYFLYGIQDRLTR